MNVLSLSPVELVAEVAVRIMNVRKSAIRRAGSYYFDYFDRPEGLSQDDSQQRSMEDRLHCRELAKVTAVRENARRETGSFPISSGGNPFRIGVSDSPRSHKSTQRKGHEEPEEMAFRPQRGRAALLLDKIRLRNDNHCWRSLALALGPNPAP